MNILFKSRRRKKEQEERLLTLIDDHQQKLDKDEALRRQEDLKN
ncbi:hypothetical protein [Alkaliphilus hydrothermalis]|uniref:Fur-regulated basic protein B n=1 Tax=Alkaliphilus hydrothermalis TaxID=1482730 RepID=A0ABS2NPR6_9FIRM|nr:hypothetical protein [Alkaliphilus hydrothermalis]MBM7614921.1 hypothetical protein [Alkaliphilus hydrothermalis]